MILLASSSVGGFLLLLKIAFLVLLYAFVWRVIRTAGKEPKVSAGAGAGKGKGRAADSMILTPSAAAAAGLGSGGSRARRSVHLVVQRSPSLEANAVFAVDSAPVTVGRGGQNDLVLDGDEFASARHARASPMVRNVFRSFRPSAGE